MGSVNNDKDILCIDRIENGIAAAYSRDGEKTDIICGDEFSAGDIVYFDGEKYVRDEELTRKRKKRLKKLRRGLSDKNSEQ